MINFAKIKIFFLFFLIIHSCGIETIVTLNSPSIDYLSQSNFKILSFTNSLAGTSDFLGYEIYYKIYPSLSTAAHLTSDKDYLTNYGATKEMLYQLGYKRLNRSLTQRTIEPLIDVVNNNINNSNTIISIDFTDCINKTINAVTLQSEPVLTMTNFSAVNLYRGILGSDNQYKLFSILYNSSSIDTDMDSTITSSTNSFEICFFVSSYAWSPDDGATYSVPVPLGIIRK